MCGIIGVLGKSEVQDRLVDGLARLEYRGYDSAGIAVVDRTTVGVVKAVGKLDNLRSALVGRVGIGHTRWATHGAANEVNAHPHSAENVTVVHNGIIENHAEIKEELRALGVVFVSDTDTEVIAQLMNRAPVSAATLDEAARLRCLRPPTPFTEDVSCLEDGDWAVLTHDRGLEVTREIQRVPAETFAVDKGPYRHFMFKEIHEEPESLARCLRNWVDHSEGKMKSILPGVAGLGAAICSVACGSDDFVLRGFGQRDWCWSAEEFHEVGDGRVVKEIRRGKNWFDWQSRFYKEKYILQFSSYKRYF